MLLQRFRRRAMPAAAAVEFSEPNLFCRYHTRILSRLQVRHRSVFASAPRALEYIYILKYVVRADRSSEIKVHRVQVGVAGCSGPRCEEDAGWEG